ncbi:MAG TPA: diguanylate cyclase [Pyrinomonadaceae bacterium]|nr:diguanylate cyclase [Pyrinomonadaceae bacterium]
MTDVTTEKKQYAANGFWVVIAGIFAVVTAISVTRTFAFGGSKLSALAVAIIVAVLVCRHRLQIPQTKFLILAKDMFALWGIIWLGIGGGVLLAIAASAAMCYGARYQRRRTVLQIGSDAIATFAVAGLYFLVSNYLAGGKGSFDSFETETDLNIIAAVLSMAAIHFVINSTLIYVGRRVNGEQDLHQLIKENYFFPAVSYLLTIATTLLLHFTFMKFGLEFGLVILVVTVMGSIANTVHRQRLATKTREITEASRMHLATVEALATAIDARDQMGIGHVRRTQIFAVGLGEFLGLGENEINALRTGALLHDIGKLAVPDHILNKPGTLTQAEIEKTKIHSSVGASILEKVGFDTPVVPTVKYHHENWDGSGYPEALKGENIPLTARILAVADAYDTLRGARPYRPPVSKNEACAILESDAGRKFDPRLVRVFLDNLGRFEAEATRQGLGYDFNRGDDRLRHLTNDEKPNYVEQIKLANREAITLYELAKDFSSSLSLSETANLFSEKIREFVHFDTCSIYLLDEESGLARSIHVAGKHAAIFNAHTVKSGEGITGRVLATGAIARNTDPWPDLKLLRSSVTSDYRSMVSLPLMTDGKLIGAVSLYSNDPTGYGDEHLRLLETISRIASDAIAKSLRHAETENHALTDPMTGLPNARSLQAQFDREVARAHRAGSTFQVLMLDLDGFKKVNDTFGHKAGDRMLVGVGRAIGSQLREYDFLARYAGDEFVALIADTSSDAVKELCERIESAVSAFTIQIDEDFVSVGVSIGSATYPYSGKSFDELLIAADKGMYTAKARRKQAEARLAMIPKPDRPLEFDMSLVVDIDEIDSVFDVDETHICGVEANDVVHVEP